MKFVSLKIKENKILSSLDLDFTDENNNVFDSIIFAGENGTGKTTVINCLFEIAQLKFDVDKGGEKREYVLELNSIDKDVCLRSLKLPKDKELDDRIRVTFDYADNKWDQIKLTLNFTDGTNQIFNGGQIQIDEIKRMFFSIYLDTEINFKSEQISTVKSNDIDKKLSAPIRSNENTTTDLKQLFVDIQTADNKDYSEYGRKNGQIPPENERDVRTSRFKNAFSYMFPKKEYVGVESRNEQQKIIFEENGKECFIDDLSSGEKQIVYRGGFLLRDKGSLDGVPVYIDEPEISLHPKWQLKIVDFYRSLFTDTEGTQTSQIFFATHSPFIIHDSIDAKVVILDKDEQGNVFVSDDPKFFNYSEPEKINEPVNLSSYEEESDKEVILLTEGKTDVQIIETAWKKLHPNEERFFDIRNGYSASLIHKQLDDHKLYAKNPGIKFVGLFDFDSGYNEWNGLSKKWNSFTTDKKEGICKVNDRGRGYASLLPVPNFRDSFASVELAHESTLSIEFLFPDDVINSDELEKKKVSQTQVEISKFKDNKKDGFSKRISGLPADKFTAFEKIFDILKKVKN